jgi:hypothetical protein
MNNVEWGHAAGPAAILVPGDTAGEGRCSAGEWGVQVDDIVAYSSLAGLRQWATSVLDALPPERHGAPLIVVDQDRQRQWLTWSGVLERITEADHEPSDTATLVRELVHAVSADPAAAGWTLGPDVASVWAELDDTDGVVAGVRLAASGYDVGIGEPLLDNDLRCGFLTTRVEQADSCLRLIATRINKAY